MFKVPHELENVIEATPDTLHGAVRFKGSRVFAQQLFDYVFAGDSIEAFLEDFPEIPRESVEALLQWERLRLEQELSPKLSA